MRQGSEPTIDVPRADLAVVQSQAEVLRTPGYDLRPFLQGRPDRWRADFATERTVESGSGPRATQDALVLGFNAVYHCGPAAREAVRARATSAHVVILHQRDQDCFDFLDEKLALELRTIGGADRRAVSLPPERDPDWEPLLNWPTRALPDGDTPGPTFRAIRGLVPRARTNWRVVLEIEDDGERVPVLLRTARFLPQRIVVCALLLEPREPADARLLENALTYCASGAPDVSVVRLRGDGADRDGYDPTLLADRMRLRGANAVEVALDPEALDVEDWPLRLTRHVVVPARVEPGRILDGADAWSAGGGTLVRVGAEGEMSLHSRANDAYWVAERWVAWYRGTPPAAWTSSIFATRSVLRVLETLKTSGQVNAGTLGLRELPPSDRDAVAALLERRIENGSCEQTMSATAAALDIAGLVEGVLPDSTERDVRSWLTQAFHGHADPVGAARPDTLPTLDDQLDIARALQDATLLRAAWERLRDEDVTAVTVTRLREAVAGLLDRLARASSPDPLPDWLVLPDEVVEALDAPLVVDQLEEGALVSADFLAAVSALHGRAARWTAGTGAPARTLAVLARRDGRPTQVAVRTLARRGRLSGRTSGVGAEPSPHELSAEAIALLEHIHVAPTSTLPIDLRSGDLPAAAAQDVLREADRARRAEETARGDLRALGIGSWLLATLALAAGALGVRWGLGGPDPGTGDLIVAGVGLVTGLVLGAVLLRWQGADGESAVARTALGCLVVVVGVVTYRPALSLTESFPGALGETTGGVIALLVAGILAVGLRWLRLFPAWLGELLESAEGLPLVGRIVRRFGGPAADPDVGPASAPSPSEPAEDAPGS